MISHLQKLVQRYKRSHTTQAVVALVGSNLLAGVVGFFCAFVQGRFLAPEDLGYFQQFGIVSGYLFFLHLGTFHAVERYYPYLIGKGEPQKAVAVVEVASTWVLMVCIPLGAFFIVLSCIGFLQGNWKNGLGWLAQSAFIVSSLYGGVLGATYRSGREFKTMAKANMWGPPIMLFMLPVFFVQPYLALFLKNVSSQVVILAKLYQSRPLRVKWRFSFGEWWLLIRQGLPRFTASYVSSAGLEAVRATIILHYLGRTELGYWSFAWMIMMLGRQIPQAMTAVFIPRIALEYGESGSPSKCIYLCRKPMIFGFMTLVLVIPLGIIGAKYVMPLLLPKYVASGGVACLLLLSLPFKLFDAPGTVLSAMNWLVWGNVSAIADATAQVAFAVFGIFMGWELYGVALGVFVGHVVRVIVLWGVLEFACRLERRSGGAHLDSIVSKSETKELDGK